MMEMTKEVFETKIDAVSKIFNEIQSEIGVLNKKIEDKKNELIRLQGEYRVLVQMLDEMFPKEAEETKEVDNIKPIK